MKRALATQTERQYRIEYEHEGRVWATVVEAYDRDAAVRQFERENPHVKCLRAVED